MLSGSTAGELDNAAYQQDKADYYEEQQAQHAQDGDFEAAKEDAQNAAGAQWNADFQAGGDDHTGQARAEADQMDWAVYEEDNANWYADRAEESAAAGDLDAAQGYADVAAEHQDAADYHGDLGEHGAEGAVYDPSSEVYSGGSYDADSFDAGSYDSGYDASAGVDTTYDAGTYDTSTTDYSTE